MSKKSFWDNSKLQEDIQWDNQELPEMPDKILLTKNWNRHEGNKTAAKTRESDQVFKQKRLEGIKKNNQDPDYRKRYLKGNSKKYKDPDYWKKYYEAIKKRDADPEYHKKRIQASNATVGIKIQTPMGEFDTISEAARAYGMTSEGMRHRVNSDRYPDFIKIEK
jgi:hypothetical protein